jgi:hypothetical protein
MQHTRERSEHNILVEDVKVRDRLEDIGID